MERSIGDFNIRRSRDDVAIGGLNERTVDVLAGTGVRGAAVVSALFSADDVRGAAQRLSERLHHVL